MDEEAIERLYSLGCGEQMNFNEHCITRVPGGWLWLDRWPHHSFPVFVPFNNEYMQEEDNDE
jgi:hypothetical protein